MVFVRIDRGWDSFLSGYSTVSGCWRRLAHFNPCYRTHQRIHRAAHAAVRRAIKRGDLVRPDQCSCCGKPGRTIAHHWSYGWQHWTDVVWLCGTCHGRCTYSLDVRREVWAREAMEVEG